MAGECVLIVDDAPVNLKLADILLRKEGFRVQTARDAAEALSALGSFQPDLMLVSARLPGMDGLELVRCVKADPDTRHIVVVALTLSAAPAEQVQAEEAGCAGCISRPLDPRELGGQVRAYLARRPRTQRQTPVHAPKMAPDVRMSVCMNECTTATVRVCPSHPSARSASASANCARPPA